MRVLSTIVLCLVFSAGVGASNPIEVESKLERLKEIIRLYQREELLTSVVDQHWVSENYDLDWKPYRPCNIVIKNIQEYRYLHNFNNDKTVVSYYYINSVNLEASPIRENLVNDISNVIPLRSSKEKIRSYIRSKFGDEYEVKNYNSYQLILVKFFDTELRKEFGRILIDVINECKSDYLYI